ncbi:unnamed protein product [Dicrocoelium dendriticum]|nr:unnamed protein product [Dicrocoelium dendriticum]
MHISFPIQEAAILPDWRQLAEELTSYVSGDFLLKQLQLCFGGTPHPVGSLENCALAELIASDWKSWGIPVVQLQDFFVSLPLGPPSCGPWNEVILVSSDGSTVLHRSRNFVEVPSASNSKFIEGLECEKSDVMTNHGSGTRSLRCLPAYQAYSSSGQALGRFVFVNYCRSEDLVAFDLAQGRKAEEPSLLCSSDIIAVARLQMCTRQSKILSLMHHCKCGKNGQPLSDHHPAALVLYPDPADSVPSCHDIYPNGPGLPGDAPVFGHVCMAHHGGGNPNTPYLPSSPHVYETNAMTPGDALTLIPVQPIGYDDAAVILSHLSGPPIPTQWNGCLAARLGPSVDSQLQVTVNNAVSTDRVRCVNVLGVIPGDVSADDSDQYVLYGCHRDTWIEGACDPGSGTAILQQICYTLGLAYERGFRPRRTIVLASWDGEELSLLGSTHMVEERNNELRQRAVAYINTDCPIKGGSKFRARTDELLADVLFLASRFVKVDPPLNTNTLFDEWLAQNEEPSQSEPRLSPPGVGSDHIPFAFKLGVPSSYPEFEAADGLFTPPMYHTAYDTVGVVCKFLDPPSITGPLPRHRLIARLSITMLLQLSCSKRIPYSVTRWTHLMNEKWRLTQQQFESSLNNLQHFGIHLDWITESFDALVEAAESFTTLLDTLEARSSSFPSALNRILIALPKQFLRRRNGAFGSFPNVLCEPAGLGTKYFPHVQRAFDNFVRHANESGDAISSSELSALKHELSELTCCIQQASSWLKNGLLGLDPFQDMTSHDVSS